MTEPLPQLLDARALRARLEAVLAPDVVRALEQLVAGLVADALAAEGREGSPWLALDERPHISG